MLSEMFIDPSPTFVFVVLKSNWFKNIFANDFLMKPFSRVLKTDFLIQSACNDIFGLVADQDPIDLMGMFDVFDKFLQCSCTMAMTLMLFVNHEDINPHISVIWIFAIHGETDQLILQVNRQWNQMVFEFRFCKRIDDGDDELLAVLFADFKLGDIKPIFPIDLF